MRVEFLGATETVTGSRTLVEVKAHSKVTRVLIDCGLFQGYKTLRLKNWLPFPIDASEIDAVILTHAHLDHSGYLPKLINDGFQGPVYCTAATRELCGILLPDSGYLQEEEAKFANKKGFSKHNPALPLYSHKDAINSLSSFQSVDWGHRIRVSEKTPDFTFEFHRAGHLLGAATVLLRNGSDSIAFSGDIGRIEDPLIKEPDFKVGANHVVIESTYGDRLHDQEDPKDTLEAIINRTFDRKGVLLIPSFAVGRAQLMLHYIHSLVRDGRIPKQPVYLNSPMASKANKVFLKFASECKVSKAELEEIYDSVSMVDTVEESVALNERTGPMILIAASGMATGGRVLHHLKAFAGDPKNTILFAGFQAGGTRGDTIVRGASEVKIHGEYWPIRAEVVQMHSLSAHADRDGLLHWLNQMKQKPKKIFINHGEISAADRFRQTVEESIRVTAVVPEYGQKFDL